MIFEFFHEFLTLTCTVWLSLQTEKTLFTAWRITYRPTLPNTHDRLFHLMTILCSVSDSTLGHRALLGIIGSVGQRFSAWGTFAFPKGAFKATNRTKRREILMYLHIFYFQIFVHTVYQLI